MINLATGVLDIVKNPDIRGVGANINQNTVSQKVNDTVQKQTATTVQQATTQTKNSVNNLSSIVASSTKQLSQQIFGDQTNYISTLVNKMLNTTVEKKLQDEIKQGNLSLQKDELDKTYTTATAYYKKIYDGSLSMKQISNKTEKNISDLINKRLIDKLSSWQNGSLDIQRVLLPQSKLVTSLRNSVINEVHTAISSLVSDKMISGINDTLLKNLKSISGNIGTTINTTFTPQIESVVKLKSIVQEKIVEFTKLKQEYEQKITSAIQSLTGKISEAMQQFTQKLVDSVAGSVKNLVSGLKLA